MKKQENNPELSQNTFSELTSPTYSYDEVVGLSDAYSKRNDIADIAHTIVLLMESMRSFLLNTQVDENVPEMKFGQARVVKYGKFAAEGGIKLVNEKALNLLNSVAMPLNEAIDYQANTATLGCVHLQEAIGYCKALITRRLEELEAKNDPLWIVYKNTQAHEKENLLKKILLDGQRPTHNL